MITQNAMYKHILSHFCFLITYIHIETLKVIFKEFYFTLLCKTKIKFQQIRIQLKAFKIFPSSETHTRTHITGALMKL